MTSRARPGLERLRSPFGRLRPTLERFRPAFERVGLPAWFIAVDLLWIAKPDIVGIDARHYQRAATAWLAGGDPWAVTEHGVTYAAGPHTLLFYAPTSLLPLDLAVALWVGLGFGASVWVIRRLKLPLWWAFFPPLVHAAWNGNPQSVALALLLMSGAVPAVAAVGLKLYAAVPLLTRPRVLLLAVLALAVTLVVLPVEEYIDSGMGVTNHLQQAWNGSAWRVPVLVLPTLLALWVLRRRGAEWLAVPAAWPATQFYYIAMALPAIAGRPLLAATFALPLPLLVPVVVMALAMLELRTSPAPWGLLVPAAPERSAWLRRLRSGR